MPTFCELTLKTTSNKGHVQIKTVHFLPCNNIDYCIVFAHWYQWWWFLTLFWKYQQNMQIKVQPTTMTIQKSILSRLSLKVLDIFLLKRTWNWRTFSQRHLWSDSFNLCSFPIILFDKKYSIINFLFFNCYLLTRSYIQIINNNICLQFQKIIDVDREVTKKLKWTGSFSLFLFHFSVRLECLSLRFLLNYIMIYSIINTSETTEKKTTIHVDQDHLQSSTR